MADNRAYSTSPTDLSVQLQTGDYKVEHAVNRRPKKEEYPMHELKSNEVEQEKDETTSKSSSMNLWYHDNVAVYAFVSAFALLGCAIRIGTETLLGPSVLNIESAESVIFVSFFSNMLGSFILGLLTGSTLKGMSGMLPIYTGISTGLCGSITTYAKFNQQISEMIVGEAETEGNRYFTAFIAVLLGIAAPLSSFKFGQDISHGIRKLLTTTEGTSFGTRNLKHVRTSILFLNYFTTALLLFSLVALLTVSVLYSGQQEVIFVCLSIAMAPLGALLRFILARFNTGLLTRKTKLQFPHGTFIANFLASVILAAMHVVQTWAVVSCPWFAVIRAVGTGFCACLSTVSSFVAEISAMREKESVISSHFYPFLTIIICELIACVINGVSYSVYLNDSMHLLSNGNCSNTTF